MSKVIENPGMLFAKARDLAQFNNVKRLGPKTWYVKSYHPNETTGSFGYLVRIQEDGKIVCTCKGFKTYGYCSHAIAVAISCTQGSRLRI